MLNAVQNYNQVAFGAGVNKLPKAVRKEITRQIDEVIASEYAKAKIPRSKVMFTKYLYGLGSLMSSCSFLEGIVRRDFSSVFPNALFGGWMLSNDWMHHSKGICFAKEVLPKLYKNGFKSDEELTFAVNKIFSKEGSLVCTNVAKVFSRESFQKIVHDAVLSVGYK